MKKGAKITPASHMSEESLKYWGLTKGDEHTVVRVFFDNGEHHVKTDKGEWPFIFFEEV